MMKRMIAIMLLSVGFVSAMEKEVLPFNVDEYETAYGRFKLAPATFNNLNYKNFRENFDQLIKNEDFVKHVPDLIEKGEQLHVDKGLLPFLSIPVAMGVAAGSYLITASPYFSLTILGGAVTALSTVCLGRECLYQREVEKKLRLLKKAQAILDQQSHEQN